MKLAVIAVLLVANLSGAATYYVRTDGNNGNNGLTNTAGGAWLTLAQAAGAVVGGDVVRIQPGTYDAFTETTDGSSSNTITYVADGEVTLTNGTVITGDYVRLVGLTFNCLSNVNDALTLQGTTGCEVWHCAFVGFNRAGIRNGTGYNNKFLAVGNAVTNRWGTGTALIDVNGTNTLCAYNVMSDAAVDYFTFHTEHGKFINNFGLNADPESAGHTDFLQTGTVSGLPDNRFTLIEANLFVGSDSLSTDLHFSNMTQSGGWFRNILSRRNVVRRTSTGGHGVWGHENFHVVHDVYEDDQRNQPNEQKCVYTHSTTTNAHCVNTIFWRGWGATSAANQVRGYLFEGPSSGGDYNLMFEPTNSVSYVTVESQGITGQDPLFVNRTANQLWLSNNSPAIGAGGPVTTVISPSGTGTSFDVADGGYFRGRDTVLDQYGGALFAGDRITVGTDQLTVSSVSESNITVTASFTWTTNDSVWLGWDTTPDIGAYPSNFTALSSATISSNGTAYTVTPDGDTRWVVFFRDSIPVFVDDASPYTATIADGVVTARAYPLYAQTTLFVDAQESEPEPEPEPQPASGRPLWLLRP